ncbi:unnamed protein product [Gemmata massiliana]|uniref:DUF4760 domain-containing protein n=1 Tax=Gemmata massiliana TaxID=1210884 RepID=A0A6P2D2X2_9BACT|nr:hypothetical protein [Gemmata massiliana]VTR94755.1 unnamed protein product [Gemmata massiliana]
MPKIHAAFILILCATLIGAVFYVAWLLTLDGHALPSADDWKNFYSLVGVGIAAVSGIIGVWVSFRNLAAQAKTSVDVERVKKSLEKSVPAYGNLFASASRYYRSLAPLETGNFNIEVIENSEGKMKDVEGEIVFVDNDYEKLWFDFWQEARYIKEQSSKPLSPEERKHLWSVYVKSLSARLNKMKEVAKNTIRG